jgi:hypothetical protein
MRGERGLVELLAQLEALGRRGDRFVDVGRHDGKLGKEAEKLEANAPIDFATLERTVFGLSLSDIDDIATLAIVADDGEDDS